MSRNVVLNTEEAWNAVSLEERLELVSRSNGDGVLAALMSATVLGSVAWSLDKIWLFYVGSALSLLFIPLIANLTWRRSKPELILRYLAARAMARRYATAHKIEGSEVAFLFRGVAKVDEGQEGEVEELAVWICLLRGAVILLSERPGGARLEFLSAISGDSQFSTEDDPAGRPQLILNGSGIDSGRTCIISSRYVATFYVFQRLFSQLQSGAALKKSPLTVRR